MPESSDKVSPIPQKKQSGVNWPVTVVSILLLISIIAAFFYWFFVLNPDSKSQEPVSTQTQQESSESAKLSTKSAQKNETAGWKTFESEGIGYSVKMPEKWRTTTGAKNELCVPNLDFWGPTKNLLGVCASEFGGMVTVTEIDENYASFTKNFDPSYLKSPKTVNTTVGGRDAIKISGIHGQQPMDIYSLSGSKEIKYLINKGGKVLAITYIQKVEWKDHSETFEKIIETFQFLN